MQKQNGSGLLFLSSADYRLLFNVSVTEKTQHGQDISADQ